MGQAFEGAFEASIAVVVAMALGYYCDRWLGTGPVFLFLGLIVGAVAGFRRLLQIRWPETSEPRRGPEHTRSEGSEPRDGGPEEGDP